MTAVEPVRLDPRPALRSSSGSHPLLAFTARRLLSGVLTLFVASVLIFLAINVLPGSVAASVLGRNADPTRVASLNERLGLDRPLLVRYLDWVSGIFHGDLGQSAIQLAQGADSAPISHILATPLLNSLSLAVITAALLVPSALLVGGVAAVRAGRKVDVIVSYTALVLGALPEFVLGTLLILVFFSVLNVLPPVALVAQGDTPFTHPNVLILPVMTLFFVSLAFASRQVRAGMIEALGQDFVSAARLNGLRERRVLARYALRNALASSVQTFAQTLQYLFGGIIIVEALFAFPGIGQLLVTAVAARDLPEVQAIAVVLAALYILINIAADLIVVLLVPKLRTGV